MVVVAADGDGGTELLSISVSIFTVRLGGVRFSGSRMWIKVWRGEDGIGDGGIGNMGSVGLGMGSSSSTRPGGRAGLVCKGECWYSDIGISGTLGSVRRPILAGSKLVAW